MNLDLSPGDTLAATGMVESLARLFPGKYRIGFKGTASEVFEHNPNVCQLESVDRQIRLEYPLIHQTHTRPTTFLEAYCYFVGEQLGIDLRCVVNRPFLYLSEEEKGWVNQVEELAGKRVRFAVVNAGRKEDYTVKHWGTANYQAVIDHYRGRLQFVQVGETNHYHPLLNGVIDLRGKTDHRQLYRLIYHSELVLGPESYTHHIAAALQKPAVTLLSGFLPAHWIAYPTARLIHVQGTLPCCRLAGCWKGKVTKDQGPGALCELPDLTGAEPLPKCLAMIRPSRVIEAIEDFIVGGVVRCS